MKRSLPDFSSSSTSDPPEPPENHQLTKKPCRDDYSINQNLSEPGSLFDLANFSALQGNLNSDTHFLQLDNAPNLNFQTLNTFHEEDYAEGIVHPNSYLYNPANLLSQDDFLNDTQFKTSAHFNTFPNLEPNSNSFSADPLSFSPTSNFIQLSDNSQSTYSKTMSVEDISECNSAYGISLSPNLNTFFNNVIQTTNFQDISSQNTARASSVQVNNTFNSQINHLSQSNDSSRNKVKLFHSSVPSNSPETETVTESKAVNSKSKALTRRPPDLSDRLASLVRSKCVKIKKSAASFTPQPNLSLFSNNAKSFFPVRVPFPITDPTPEVKSLLELPSFHLLNRGMNADLNVKSNNFSNSQAMSCEMFQSNDITQINIPKLILRDGLLALAKAIATHDNVRAEKLMTALASEADTWGCTMQRITAHFLSALSSKQRGDGHEYRGDPLDIFSVADALTEFCLSVPYLPFWMDASIGCLYDNIESYNSIHIIDFSMWLGFWPTLFRKLAFRKDKIPTVRFTAIEIPMDSPRGTGPRCLPEVLEKELVTVAGRLGIEFEFRVVHSKLENLRIPMLGLRNGEALAVYCGLCPEQLLDASVIRSNPRDSVLKLIHSMRPKVAVMCNLETNCNSPFFLHRFREVLDYYIAIFDSHDSAVPRSSMARHLFEGVINKPQIMEIVACEGMNRYERAETLQTWTLRMLNVGLVHVPPSQKLRYSIDMLFDNFPKGFKLLENDDFLYLSWKGIALAGVSTWKPIFSGPN